MNLRYRTLLLSALAVIGLSGCASVQNRAQDAVESVTFTATSPQTAAHSSTTAQPATTHRCQGGVLAGTHTSCLFAENVQGEFYGQTAADATVSAYSTVTKEEYSVHCVQQTNTTVRCTGENGILVMLDVSGLHASYCEDGHCTTVTCPPASASEDWICATSPNPAASASVPQTTTATTTTTTTTTTQATCPTVPYPGIECDSGAVDDTAGNLIVCPAGLIVYWEVHSGLASWCAGSTPYEDVCYPDQVYASGTSANNNYYYGPFGSPACPNAAPARPFHDPAIGIP